MISRSSSTISSRSRGSTGTSARPGPNTSRSASPSGASLTLLGDAPPQKLVAHSPVYLRGALPEVPFTPKSAADRLIRLEAIGADLSLSRFGTRHRRH